MPQLQLPLPSIQYKSQFLESSASTILRRNQKWFIDTYMLNTIKPIEPNFKEVLEIGKIYTFAYDPIYKDELSFYDNMPINLILGYILTKKGHLNPYGINLSFVPPKIRIKILDIIWKIFKTNYIIPNIEKISEENFKLKIIPIQYDVCKKILNNSGFEFAIRSYRMDHFMSRPQIVSYEDWWRLNTLSSVFIRKLTSRMIYYRYHKNIIDGYKVGEKTKVEITKTKVSDIKKYLKTRYQKES